MEDDIEVEQNAPRRSLRLALSEINETAEEHVTPNKSSNVEELLVMQRGPRRKPLTWSPVDYDRTKLLRPPREKTPEPVPQRKSEMNPRLRRRLIMTPEKNPSQELGYYIAKKLKTLKSLEKAMKTKLLQFEQTRFANLLAKIREL